MSRTWIFAFFIFFIFGITSAVSGGPIITTPPQIFAVQLRHQVKLPCDVEDNVADNTIFWSRGKEPLFIGAYPLPGIWRKHYELDENSSLFVKNFTSELAGTYTCRVFNQAVSHEVWLQGGLPEKIQMKNKETITLPCHPALKNSSKVLRRSDFEWVMDNEVPVYSKGNVSSYFNLAVPEDIYIVENSSLILRNPTPGDVTLTCRLIHLNINYTYRLQVKPPSVKTYCRKRRIDFQMTGKTIALPCRPFESALSEDTNYAWVLRNDYQCLDVISFKQRILLQNNTARYRINEKGYLVIPNFIPVMDNHYECYLSSKITNTLKLEYFSWFADGERDYLDDIYTSHIENIHHIEEGDMITIKCPTNKPDFAWIRNRRDYLFISGSAVKSSKTDGLEMHSDGKSLTITNFSSSLGGYYECRSSAGLEYGYYVGEKSFENQSVGAGKSVHRTVVAEFGKNMFLDCPTGEVDSSNRLHFVWIRNDAELLFINENPIRRSKTHKLMIAEDKRSLVIVDFTASVLGTYTCLTSGGINYVYNVTTSNATQYKTQTLIVDYATRRTILPCPATNNNENASYEWIFLPEASIAKLSLLFINQVEFTTAPFQGLYKINDDRSLVISVMNAETYGLYKCRWTTGEEYSYNIITEIKWKNKTVLVKEGENVTLPCPQEDPRDRELNAVDWEIMLNNGYNGAFQFLDGKMIPPLGSYELLDNLNLANDKQSLIVSDVTINMQGLYFCVLFQSSTYYKYTVRIV